jgi:hypothetical protein
LNLPNVANTAEANIDFQIVSYDPSKLLQCLQQSLRELLTYPVGRRQREEQSNATDARRLLPSGHYRPRRRAAERRDEGPPSHVIFPSRAGGLAPIQLAGSASHGRSAVSISNRANGALGEQR